MEVQSYRDLEVWQVGMDMSVGVYRLMERMPASEMYSLTDQIKRAASSVPANIAEGWGRSFRKEYLQYLSVARGSLCELETHLILAGRLGYITREDTLPIWALCQRVGKMLTKLTQSIRKRKHDPGQTSPKG
jgi:four helix bundle protein